jgi:hypothetical protein
VALSTAGDVIGLALRAAGVVGVGQAALPQDTSDALDLMNTLLIEWQINRWLAADLTDSVKVSTGVANYTVGVGGDFVTSLTAGTPRPDKIDSAVASLISTGAGTILYPYMSREGYQRVINKSLSGPPERFYYDAVLGPLGMIFFTPVPSNLYSLSISFKPVLIQLTDLAETIPFPPPYIVALLWNLAADLRPAFQKAEDPQVTARAARSLLAIGGSVAQVPNAVTPLPSPRAGIFSNLQPQQRQ